MENIHKFNRSHSSLLLLAALIAVSNPVVAEETEALVWMHYDQAALDAAYDQAVYAPNLSQVLDRQKSNSKITRKILGEPDRFEYGTGKDETLEVFKTQVTNAPIHVFVHGGTWRFGNAAENSYLAEIFVNAGAHFVALDFTPIQDFDSNLPHIVDQIRRAMVWIHRNAAKAFGGDPDKIYLSGFSSGGHLAGTLVTTDWSQYEGTPKDLIKGALLCSGMYGLVPVSLSARREYVNFTEETISQLSPLSHIDKISCPLIIAYGTFETPEFQRQSIEFSTAVETDGKPVSLIIGDGYNHFEMIETLASPYGILGRAVLKQMTLPR